MTYVSFNLVGSSTSGKTSHWAVIGGHGVVLGYLKWFGPWRKYTLFAGPGMIFDPDCLRGIADFCESRTLDHWAVKKEDSVPMVTENKGGES